MKTDSEEIQVQAYEVKNQIVVLFGREEIPDDHDCDQMGCGQCHVKYRFSTADSWQNKWQDKY